MPGCRASFERGRGDAAFVLVHGGAQGLRGGAPAGCRAARWRTGGWPSTTSGTRWRRRRRRKTSRRPGRDSTRRARSGPRPSASATGSRRSASTTAIPTRCRSTPGSLAYTKAMERMTQRYPDDFEAWTYYALTLQASAPRNDKSLRRTSCRSAEILERLFKQNPEHPGVAHYLVHAYDYPPLADKGDPNRRAIRAHRAGRAARAAHAVTHLFDGGDVGGVHRLEPLGARGPARLSPRDGLHGLRPSPARAGRQGQGAGRSHRRGCPSASTPSSRTSRRSPRSRRATRSSAPTGPARPRCRSSRPDAPWPTP